MIPYPLNLLVLSKRRIRFFGSAGITERRTWRRNLWCVLDCGEIAREVPRSITGSSLDPKMHFRAYEAIERNTISAYWLFFNVEGLSSDPKLETAMSMLIANAMAERASGKSGQPSITVLDDSSLLDSPVLAPEVVQQKPLPAEIAKELQLFVGDFLETTRARPACAHAENDRWSPQKPPARKH